MAKFPIESQKEGSFSFLEDIGTVFHSDAQQPQRFTRNGITETLKDGGADLHAIHVFVRVPFAE